MARFRTLALLLVLLLTISACSSSNLSKDEYDSGHVGAPGNDESPEDSSLGMPRQIIYKASLTISVADLDTAINALNVRAPV